MHRIRDYWHRYRKRSNARGQVYRADFVELKAFGLLFGQGVDIHAVGNAAHRARNLVGAMFNQVLLANF